MFTFRFYLSNGPNWGIGKIDSIIYYCLRNETFDLVEKETIVGFKAKSYPFAPA